MINRGSTIVDSDEFINNDIQDRITSVSYEECNQSRNLIDLAHKSSLFLGRLVGVGAVVGGMVGLSHIGAASGEELRPIAATQVANLSPHRSQVDPSSPTTAPAPKVNDLPKTARVTYSTILTEGDSLAKIDGEIDVLESREILNKELKTNHWRPGGNPIEPVGRRVIFTQAEVDQSTDKALITKVLTRDPIRAKVNDLPKTARVTYSTILTEGDSLAKIDGEIDVLESREILNKELKTNHWRPGGNPIEPVGRRVIFTQAEVDQSTDKALITKVLTRDPIRAKVKVTIKKPPTPAVAPVSAPVVSKPAAAVTLEASAPVSTPEPTETQAPEPVVPAAPTTTTIAPASEVSPAPAPTPPTPAVVAPASEVSPAPAPLAPVQAAVPAPAEDTTQISISELEEYASVLAPADNNNVVAAPATPAVSTTAPVSSSTLQEAGSALADVASLSIAPTPAPATTQISTSVTQAAASVSSEVSAPAVSTQSASSTPEATVPATAPATPETIPPKTTKVRHLSRAERRKHAAHEAAVKDAEIKKTEAQAAQAAATEAADVHEKKVVAAAKHQTEAKARAAKRKATKHLGKHALKSQSNITADPGTETQSTTVTNNTQSPAPAVTSATSNTTAAASSTAAVSNETSPTIQQAVASSSETQTNPNPYNLQQYTPQVITAGGTLSNQAIFNANNLSAYQAAEIQYTGDSDDTDCARETAEMLEASGIDPNVYSGIPNRLDAGTNYLVDYFANSNKYTQIQNNGNINDLLPGDIFVVNNELAAHTFTYIGNGQFVSASLGGHPPQIGSMSEIDTTTGEYGQNGTNFQIYRFTGNIPQEAYNQQAQSMGFETVPAQYLGYLDQAAQEVSQYSSLDLATIKGLLAAQINQESRWNANVPDSPAGAEGIGQFMPDTAQTLDVDPSNPSSAIPGVGKLMAQNLQIVQQNFPDITDPLQQYQLALAMYNSDPQTIINSGGVPNIGQTMVYVVNVLGSFHIYTVMVGAMENQNASIDANGNLGS